MADRVTSSNSSAAAPQWCTVIFCMLMLASFAVRAEDLPDPTRPPASIFLPATAEKAENFSSGLHSIIISDIRRAAIIDGQTVELGEEHRGARLIEVSESGVVLQRAQSRQVLSLFPGVRISRKSKADVAPAESGKASGENKALSQALPKESVLNGESPVLQELPANKAQSGSDDTKPIMSKEGK